MTQLEQLSEKIKKAVPEIMELKFGCQVKVNYPEYEEGVGESQVYHQPSNSVIFKIADEDYVRNNDYEEFVGDFRNFDKNYIGTIEDYSFEVLGRPISLEDVLMALEMKLYEEFGIEDINNTSEEVGILKVWELGVPLSEQSEEVINKLNEIL